MKKSDCAPRLLATLFQFLLLICSASADEPLSADAILDRPPSFRVESVRVRYSHFEQMGLGYQSQDGPARGPGSESLTVEQPQLEIVAKQGKRTTHRLWIPLDVVTAASPDAVDRLHGVDTISHASRINEGGSVDLTTQYRADRETSLFLRGNYHMEEQFRSWALGAGMARSLAEDNAVVVASVYQVYDWFDSFLTNGLRVGHASRSTSNGNLGLTQLLSPTTVAHVNYGVTLQVGELGNTWNSVPLLEGGRSQEHLPTLRHRHAFVARLAQWLPWQGALKAFYRFYLDDWGILAHTWESELYQRMGPRAYLRLNYRFHQQTGADFFTTLSQTSAGLQTADSDLAPLSAHTFGIMTAIDFPLKHIAGHLDIGLERYLRSNGLHASIVSCSLGLRF